MTGQSRGWASLKAVHSTVVPKWKKPQSDCQICGMPLYFLPVPLKGRTVVVAFEDGYHGDRYGKVLYNHQHMSQARGSCEYVKPDHDIKSGLKVMTEAEKASLKKELGEFLAADEIPGLAECHRITFAKRAIEIQELLRKAGVST